MHRLNSTLARPLAACPDGRSAAGPHAAEGPSARLFIAVPLPDTLKEILARRCERLRETVPFAKWVYRDDYHITVQYLGATPLQRVDAIRAKLAEAAAAQGPFGLKLSSLGAFGKSSSPQILWTGVQGELAPLEALYRRVVEAMIPFGYVPEERPYKPHITLARKYRGTEPFDARRAEASLPPLEESEWQAAELILYESRGGREPMYQPLARMPIGG
ncbi:RNA 2',3'-cyclic phosphodiesterase [Paenibacillus sp. J31TS4]|uniref:RNA 2',3'-cyclic phosphodiesterase n=1 Tax=Paenibacillus sp. J31TS4 TaxID=2807195 RepID=UPI001B0323DB|nr:RNA 2',3'-cyclic phosphodiesterase [Paenibacillus sp. J31TS4]GIP38727.1 RNA 2',3'-cyclic phosphodiesterase [Paenibacillus sp. J31TS4]